MATRFSSLSQGAEIREYAKPVTFIVDLTAIDDELTETVPVTELSGIGGLLAWRFYARPNVGETIVLGQWRFRVTEIIHCPYRPRSKKPKQFPVIKVTYIGSNNESH